jgi:hypothetical protein
MRNVAVLLSLVLLVGCAWEPTGFPETGRHISGLPLKNCQPGDFDQGPKLLHGTAPHMPMFDAGRPGNRYVHVTFTVNAGGKTEDIEVKTEESPAYATHTAAAVAEWVFQPALSGSRPVSTRCEVSLAFDAWRRPEHLGEPNRDWRR